MKNDSKTSLHSIKNTIPSTNQWMTLTKRPLLKWMMNLLSSSNFKGKNAMTKLLTTIPFSGFYESDHAMMVDDEIEQYFQTEDGHSYVPDEFWVSAFDHSAVYADYAVRYAIEFIALLDENEIPIKGMVYESMKSPKEYNFTTDSLFCLVPEATIRSWYKISKAEKHATLAKVIKEKFTSRDGFFSFYKNDINEWIIKPLEKWDHNEIGTLLVAVMEIKGLSEDDDQLKAWKIMDAARGNGVISGFVDQAMPKEFIDFSMDQREANKKLEFKEWKEKQTA